MNYGALVTEVLAENRQVLEAVNPDDVELFIQEILKAKTIHLYAMGRMQLSVRAFAMRLKHMGIDTYVVCRKAVEDLKRKGYEVIQSGKFDEDEYYYLDTEPTVGIILELGNGGKLRPPQRRLP
jgi:hypothetical protein